MPKVSSTNRTSSFACLNLRAASFCMRAQTARARISSVCLLAKCPRFVQRIAYKERHNCADNLCDEIMNMEACAPFYCASIDSDAQGRHRHKTRHCVAMRARTGKNKVIVQDVVDDGAHG